jgi:aminomethyltransferase
VSPLHDEHVALGAKFGPFAGWSMPLEYADGGVVVEHRAVRGSVGIFDVSHLGTASVQGTGARDLLNRLLTNDLDRIAPGRAQYTLLCSDDGGVVDDLIVYVRSDDDLLLIPNAANSSEVLRVIADGAPEGVTVVDRHREVAIIAVQGPGSAPLMAACGLPQDLRYMAFADAELVTDDGVLPVTVCRTGYTGEHGYEVLVPAAHASVLWRLLLDRGAAFGVRACGLAARDTLRTEMGYPLHGQDLGAAITPVMAGLGWAVGWDKPAFGGREALRDERDRGPSQRLRGLVVRGRGVPRPGMGVTDGEGAPLGTVTSGTFSPTLGTGIALALLPPSIGPGTVVAIDVRGRSVDAEVCDPPFVDASPR